MAGKLNIFQLGQLGVDLVKSPLHLPDGAWTQAQNAEFGDDQTGGGIQKRGGLSRVNSVALAGAVQSLLNVPLPYPGEFDLMVGLNTGEVGNSWKKSVDGTTYSNLATTLLQRPCGIDKFSTIFGALTLSTAQRSASYKHRFYYPGDNYTVDTTAPVVVVFNGANSYEQFRVPNNPTATGVCKWMPEFYVADNVVYLGVYDPGGVAPDHKGRVLAFDPSDGTLTQIGNRFGNGSGENAKGFPFCITSYLGYLWAGTYGISGNNQGGVYRIIPGIEETWTLDLTATLHNGYFMSLCGFQGSLFAATDADSSGTAIVQKRTSAGVWSTSLSAPASNVSYFTGLITFNGALYCAHYQPAVDALIKKFDGSSWTTSKDVGVDFAVKPPGMPFIFRGELYWPFLGSDSSASSTAGFLLKLTTGGVWSRVLTGVGLRGGLGQFVP